MNDNKILLAHGSGGRLTHELIEHMFLPHMRNTLLERMEDSAVFTLGESKLCFSTDTYVVNPIFFPGGDIGSLAIHGTVNDLAMAGGRPLFISAGFILEEGFALSDLEVIVQSMGCAAKDAGVQIVAGDTKVVARGAADGIFINTSGIGIIDYAGDISVMSITHGDVLIVNGTIGDHGAAIVCARDGISIKSPITSDSCALNGMVQKLLKVSPNIHCMRDATRGGLGAILAEMASQAGCTITIEEKDIPVKDEVRGICEILGFDPLFMANEGKMVVFCTADDAPSVLEMMRAHSLGRNAAVIGVVDEKGSGRVVMNTLIGGSRVVDLPAGELVPRIC